MRIPPRSFIIFGSVFHLILRFFVMMGTVSCKANDGCVPISMRVAAKVLDFPLGLVSLIWYPIHVDIGNGFALLGLLSIGVLNSVLAISILWWLLDRGLRSFPRYRREPNQM
jgi:hypothetical protein